MSTHSELVLELWETVKEATPTAKREDTAHKILKILDNYGIDLSEVGAELEGEDAMLDRALSEYYYKDDDSDEDDDGDY